MLNPINEQIRLRLIELRKTAGYTQKQLSSLLHLKEKSYGHYETGQATPSIQSLLQLVTLYNLKSIDELINGESSNKKLVHPIIDKYNKLHPKSKQIVDMILLANP